MKSVLYFAVTPPLQDLCTVVVKLPSSSNINQELPATFKVQPQVIKCRELIFMDGRIIATPSLQEDTTIYVILQQAYWKTGQFQSVCKKLGLEFMKPVRVISTVFQSCFSYTLKAKLAPLWNKVGEYYINGRDFLTNSGPLPAVYVDLNVTETEICLALKGFGIYLHENTLSNFNVTDCVLRQFEARKLETIPEFAIQEKWSHVLPSMKKGKVMSIAHAIPSTSPFKRYKEMRRYWKNAYGYRLPEEEGNMYYLNVHFPMIGDTIFTYPSLCVRSSEPRVIPRINPHSILMAFLRDVKTKFPACCGLPLQFSEEGKYMKGAMAQATLKVHLLSKHSITSPPPQKSRWMPTRNLDSIPPKVSQVPQVARPMAGCSLPESVWDHRMGSSCSSFNRCVTEQTPGYPLAQAATMPFSFQSEVQEDDSECTSRDSQICKAVVPMVQVQKESNFQQIEAKEAAFNPTAKRVPIFKPSKKRVVPDAKGKYQEKCFNQQNIERGGAGNALPEYLKYNSGSLSGTGISDKDWGMRNTSMNLSPTLSVSRGNAQQQLPTPMISAHIVQSSNLSSNNSEKPGARVFQSGKQQNDMTSFPPSKKQRIPSNVDVEVMAVCNQLHKVNSLTLATWLRSKDIHTQGREKKTDLVKKVLDYIRAQKSET